MGDGWIAMAAAYLSGLSNSLKFGRGCALYRPDAFSQRAATSRLLATRRESMVGQLEKDRRREPKGTPSSAKGRVAKSVPFADRLSCTIEEACEATGLGRTKVYELIGSGQLVTTTIGRRRLVMVRSLIALLGTAMSE